MSPDVVMLLVYSIPLLAFYYFYKANAYQS